MGQDVPCLDLEKLGLTVNTAVVKIAHEFGTCVTQPYVNRIRLRGRHLPDKYCCQKSRPAQWPNLLSLPEVEEIGYT